MKRVISFMLATVLVINLMACGIILHPERKGQTGGRVDFGIVALNGLGLLFFLVPGIIAFAIDFSYGTIYLPGGKRAYLTEKELDQISSNGEVSLDALSSIIQTKTGSEVSLDSKDLRVSYLQSVNQLPANFDAAALAILSRP